MLHNSDAHRHFDSAIDSGIGEPEVEYELSLEDLRVGAVIEVETAHHTYRIENRGDGKVLMVGHPTYCPKPLLVELYGSTAGAGMIKMGFLGPGMRMQFKHPSRGVIATSPVLAIRQLRPAGSQAN
jgi:hypothetical protein